MTKNTHMIPPSRIRVPFTRVLAGVSACLLLSFVPAQAHIGWSGSRNFDTLVVGVPESSTDRNVSSAFGWADGTDSTWSDSHRFQFFRFVLSSPTTVSISVSRNDRPPAPGPGTQTGTIGYFLPGFSLYRINAASTNGTMPASTHDSGNFTVSHLTTSFGSNATEEAYSDLNSNGLWNPGEIYTDANSNGSWDTAGLGNSGKEGAFNAMGNWQIYNDSGHVGIFDYVGHMADGGPINFGLAGGVSGDGVADGVVGDSYTDLPAGEYFIAVGGANYYDQDLYAEATSTFLTYGVSVTVAAIPEPGVVALAGLAAGFFGLRSIRKHLKKSAASLDRARS